MSRVSVLAKAKPLGDRVIVLRDQTNDKTEGGILLPAAAQAAQPTGVVVSVGPDVKNRLDIVPGAKVVLSNYAGLEIRDPNVVQEAEYLILREEELLAAVPQDTGPAFHGYGREQVGSSG